jgi:hypothetical protein
LRGDRGQAILEPRPGIVGDEHQRHRGGGLLSCQVGRISRGSGITHGLLRVAAAMAGPVVPTADGRARGFEPRD